MSKSFSLGAIKAMKTMAEDPKKRKALLQDMTCMGGLVMVLSNTDEEIVQMALETLLSMAEVPHHRPTLKDHMGLLPQLETIVNCEKACDMNKRLAETLYTQLTVVSDTSMTTPLKDTKNNYHGNTSMNATKSLTGKQHKARHTVLQLRGMLDKYDKDVITRLLLQVKGVISITIDLNKKRCYVRSRVDTKPQQLVAAIANSFTMTAQHVTKDENGREMLVSFGSNSHESEKENCELPSYLPDDIDNSPIAEEKTVARTGRPQKNSSWLNTAANFLTQSFYW